MRNLFLIIPGVLIFLSCNKKDPNEVGPGTTSTPVPIACFDTAKLTIPITQTVSLSSCSKNAAYHEWSFGDGDSSTDKTVNHKYEPGTYKVTLKVYNSDKSKWDVAHKEIKVGYLYVTRVTVTQYGGTIWDNEDTTRPDIFFAFHKDSVIISKTSTVYDAIPPISWSMDWKLIPGEEIGFGTYDEDPNYNSYMTYQVFDAYQNQENTLTDIRYNIVKLEYTIK